jgi:2'-5' RNA ligase
MVPTFTLAFAGVGQFPSADGAAILWAGVRPSPELLRLHAAIAATLASDGFRPESRPYTPHVTLARCEPGVPAKLIDEFLAGNAKLWLTAVTVAGFGLYSSTRVRDVPVYRCERSFELSVTKDDTEG